MKDINLKNNKGNCKSPNAEQIEVINNLDENIILYASAGTGKTFTVANRIRNIIDSDRAKPEEILCLTFTVKACNEMRDDIAHYVGTATRDIQIRTIHSFCLFLLKSEEKLDGKTHIDIDVCDDVDEKETLVRLFCENASEWEMEEYIREVGLFESLEELYNCDAIYSFTGHTYGWKINIDNQVKYLLNDKRIVPADCEDEVRDRKKIFYCPECSNQQNFDGNFCSACGFDIRRYIPPLDSLIVDRKLTNLVNIIGKIKHSRHENSFYSGDETEDFCRAIAAIEDSEKYKTLFSFYDADIKSGCTDKVLLLFMHKFGGRFLHIYNEYLRQSNLLDYDDLILCADHMLIDESVRLRWSKRFKYIFIDEMQDTSLTEYHALSQLFSNNRIMMCGDYFQTIYGWRDSKPERVLAEYTNTYNATVYMYRENYRSTKSLSSASFGYLKNTYPDLIGKYCPKDLDIHSKETGDLIEIHAFLDYFESGFVYDYLKNMNPEEWVNVCVMARSNRYIEKMARDFEMRNIDNTVNPVEFFTVERNMSFFKTAAVKDVLAFFKIVLNDTDNLSMDRIAEKYIKGVGLKTIEALHDCNEIGLAISSFLSPETYEHGENYNSLLDAFKSGNIVVYDTETTGLDLSIDQVIQIAAIKYDAFGNISDTFNEIAIPTVPMSQGAKDTIPFDVEKAISERGIDAKVVFSRFAEFVQGAVLVGHNSSRYDAPLIQRELSELGLPQLSVVAEYDTLTLAKHFIHKSPNYKLSTLCEYLGVINKNAHDALGDVEATGEVLFKIVNTRIIPTAEARKSIISKYSKKFRAFYEFKRTLDDMIEKDQLEEAVDTVINTCRLYRRYSTSDRAIKELQQMMVLPEGEQAKQYLRNFITSASFSGSQMDTLINKQNKVRMITVHQSKGCEYDTVILVGVDDRNFPSYASKISNNIEEEKRLFYVAISRAKRKLILTHEFELRDKEHPHPLKGSPFLQMIPKQYIQYYLDK